MEIDGPGLHKLLPCMFAVNKLTVYTCGALRQTCAKSWACENLNERRRARAATGTGSDSHSFRLGGGRQDSASKLEVAP